MFYNGSSEYAFVARGNPSTIEIFNEELYNEFVKEFEA